MIGYIRVYKPELKIKEYEAYRGIYCSLCKALGKEYGIFSRLLLSYDITFLTMVLLSLKNSDPCFKKGRCPFNAAKKCLYCQNNQNEFAFAAAITVVLFYFKIKDNIADNRGFKKIAAIMLLPYSSLLYRKAKRKYPTLCEEISLCMEKQNAAEHENTDSIDKAAHNTADALGKIFAFENKSSDLYRFGYLLGRWVYLIDAAEDLPKDLKEKSFNVFANKLGLKNENEIEECDRLNIQSTLNLCQCAVESTFEKLPLGIFKQIIENVVKLSMEIKTENVLKGKGKK